MYELPVIDVTPLIDGGTERARSVVGQRIDAACRSNGFFMIVGHGVDPNLQPRLDAAAREFFALPETEKARIAMTTGGKAWRGWFPLGGELTSGVPDGKEGLYFGVELADDDPRVLAGTPLHGPNLFPHRPVALRSAVLEWTAAMTELGHRLMTGVGLALGLDSDWFDTHLTHDPITLFRIFRYPSGQPDVDRWGVAEHTDYGLLTILAQDSAGGLEVRGPQGWIEVPPTTGAFVCNIGDMLDRMTGGRYRSTPHRVRSNGRDPDGPDRLSFPFFFDPAWTAEVAPLPGVAPADDAATRWDASNVHTLEGTYGDYLLAKVSKVFPALAAE